MRKATSIPKNAPAMSGMTPKIERTTSRKASKLVSSDENSICYRLKSCENWAALLEISKESFLVDIAFTMAKTPLSRLVALEACLYKGRVWCDSDGPSSSAVSLDTNCPGWSNARSMH